MGSEEPIEMRLVGFGEMVGPAQEREPGPEQVRFERWGPLLGIAALYIDVSSTNSKRQGRARRRWATRFEWALTRPKMFRCHPTPWRRATALIDITLASFTSRRAKRRVRPAWNWAWSSR